mgnify:CR=1 FL=1
MKKSMLDTMVSLETVKEECLRNAGVKKHYDAMQFKYSLIDTCREWRKKNSLSQGDVAKMIEVTQQDISRFEGGRNVTINLVSKIFSLINENLHCL